MVYRKPSDDSAHWRLPLLVETINEITGDPSIGWELRGTPTTEDEFKATFKICKTPETFNADGSTKDDVVWRTEAEWGFTWDDVKTKWDAKIAAQPLKDLRGERNDKLSETDWMANSDVTLSDDWKQYRQALRDLPANTSDPSNPTWPTKPGG